MLEIEIKSRCDNHDVIKEKIISLGGEFSRTIDEEDIYFNHPCRNFIDTDEALRIRRIDYEYFVTYKGPRIGSSKTKTRYEAETSIGDFDIFKDILLKNGYIEGGIVSKTRSIYKIKEKNIEICLDTVQGLGKFIEIEKIGEDKDAIESEIFNLAEQFNLKKFISESYLSMLHKK